MTKHRIAAVAASIALALAALAAAGCGNDDESTTTAAEAGMESVDAAFLDSMVPHHTAAIEMAEVAQQEAERPEIKQLADEIIAAQSSEIDEMNAMHERLVGGPTEGADHGGMGMDDSMMGMGGDADELAGAEPFDREFIDMMIPHHQGAIMMARMQLAKGEDPEVDELARSIIEAQSMEIEQMNEWREQWYGAPSPAGGVPAGGGESMPPDSMGGSG